MKGKSTGIPDLGESNRFEAAQERPRTESEVRFWLASSPPTRFSSDERKP